jgi:hypothetical protein
MPNINCTVCGEPWDRYGLYHGDVSPGQADAILSGKGCPSCSGFHPETDADHGYDPGAIDDASIVFEQCAHCEVAITADVGDFTYQQWKDGITRALAEKIEAIGESYGTPLARNQWSRSRDYAEFIKVPGDTLCTQCAPTCDHCGEPIDKRGDDYFFYEMNDYHVECYLEVESEQNYEYFIERMDEVLSKNDMAIDGETDYFQLSQAVDWDGSDNMMEPTDHQVIQAFIDTHRSTLIHTDFGGPYTKKQWETLLTKIEDDDTGDLADWIYSREGVYRVFIADDPSQSMEATVDNYLKYITEYNRNNVL